MNWKHPKLMKWVFAALVCIGCSELNLPFVVMLCGVIIVFNLW